MTGPQEEAGTEHLVARAAPRAGRARFAYVADETVSRAILHRLSQITAWDHAEGARIRAEAPALAGLTRDGVRPYLRQPADGVGVDREALGFVCEMPGAPAGLERLPGRSYLAPSMGDDGQPWRELLGRHATRPRLADVLAEHRVASTLHCRAGATLHRVKMLPPGRLHDAIRPAMLMWECCAPPVPATLVECQPWEFEIAAELAISATQAGRG